MSTKSQQLTNSQSDIGASASNSKSGNDGNLVNLRVDDGASSSSDDPEDQRVTERLLAPQSEDRDLIRSSVDVAVCVPCGDGVAIASELEQCRQGELVMTSTVSHPLSSQNPSTIPESSSPRQTSLSRRRGGAGSNRRGGTTATLIPPLATASSSSTTTTTSSSSLRHRTNASARSDAIDEEANAGGLRASLDAGMAAVRRWIRLRSATTTPSTHGTLSSSSTWTTPSASSLRQRPETANTSGTLEDDDFYFSTQDDNNNRAVSSTHSYTAAADTTTTDNLISFQQSLQQSPGRTQSTIGTPTILENHDELQTYRSVRQRALSEPDALRIRDFLFQRALSAPQRSFRRRRYPGGPRHSRRSRPRTVSDSIESPSSPLSPSAAEVLYASARSLRPSGERSMDLSPDVDAVDLSTVETSVQDENTVNNRFNGNNMENVTEMNPDPNREARARWIQINRRFQFVITVVALVFSLLLFAILVCWVVLTSAYVVSIEKFCDVPLKAYFWLVTLQLIMDVFRADIMRLFFRWDANSNQRIPCRVIAYNIAYLTYALLVLRLGIHCVFLDKGSECRRTAPELFQSSAAFVSLSIAAWSTIVLGYLVPFCFVATLLTLNGYTPTADTQRGGGTPGPFSVFPSAMGAPPGCVDQLRIVMLEEFPDDYPMECCICMENFVGTEVIVKTECNHVFHKQCCREWLKQARTCPVCRMDIPAALENIDEGGEHANQQQRQRNNRGTSSRLGFGPAGRPFARNDFHEMVSLLRILRHRDRRRRRSETTSDHNSDAAARNTTTRARNQPLPIARDDGPSSLEEGRGISQYSS